MDDETTSAGPSGHGMGGELRTWNYLVSGFSCVECAVTTKRYDDLVGFKAGYGECWIVSVRPDGDEGYAFHLQRGFDRYVSGLWVSPGGTCFATRAKAVMRNPRFFEDDASTSWVDDPFEEIMQGVIGLTEDWVMAWGSPGATGCVVYRFDGRRWQAVDSPDFFVMNMHAAAPSLVYAVGDHGEVARFDGSRWIRVPSSSAEPLTSVFVVSRDEIYAVGAWGGVYEGSAHGWEHVAQVPDDAAGGAPVLAAVAWWKGELWVGAGIHGLWRRDGRSPRMIQVDPDLRAVAFDARERLLMATEHDVTETRDGVRFERAAVDMVAEARGDEELGAW